MRQLDPRQALQGESFRTFAWVLVITVIAKGAAFLPGYAIDDYALVLQSSPPTATLLQQGRFGQALLGQLLYLLQLEPQYARVFFVAFALVVWSLFATLVVRYWGLERKGWLTFAIAVLVADHPFTTEIFTFRAALGSTAVSLALFTILLLPRKWSPSLVLLGAVLFAAALSIDQSVLHFSLMVFLMGTAIGLTRVLVAGGAHGWPARMTSLLSPRNIAQHRHAALLACTALGTLVYLALDRLIAAALGVASQNTEIIPFGAIPQRLHEATEALRYRLVADPLVPRSAKGLLLLLLLSALVGLLARTRPRLRLRPQILFFTIVTLIAASLMWTLGLLLVLREFWPASRVMSHAGIFWGGILAISNRCLGSLGRRGLTILSLAIVVSFLGANNRILNDQIRLNARDAQKAKRILARLELMPGFSQVEGLAIEGKTWSYPLGFKTVDHDMNISAFGATWSQVALLRDISGYDLKPVTNEIQKNAAAAYCRTVNPWPDPQSVAIRDRLAIVCLGPG